MIDATSSPIAVVGAGFSGTMVAIHLLRMLPPHQPILLFERSGRFAHGLAYSTANRGHLLNVRASNMSALPDDPNHFVRWLEQHDDAASCEMPAGSFAPRSTYGRYLEELLSSSSDSLETNGRLRLERDDVTDLVPSKNGYAVHLASGRRVNAAGVLLACGNLRAKSFYKSRHAVDPWQCSPLDHLDAEVPLMIVGTGLTMIDAVATIRDRGFTGPIIALSRRGLLPQAHGPAPA